MLHHSQVKLSDLFNGIAPDQDCDLGPAPAPGQSLTISAPQLQAIAQQYGIDWPEMSDLAQATLTRASHTVSRDDIMPLIVDGLKTRGVSDSAAIELTNFRDQPSQPNWRIIRNYPTLFMMLRMAGFRPFFHYLR